MRRSFLPLFALAMLLGATSPVLAEAPDAWSRSLAAADDLAGQGQLDAATHRLEAMLAHAPAHRASEVQLRLASILAQEHHWGSAIAHGQAAIDAWPENGWIYLPVARLMVGAARPEAAIALCAEAARRDPAVRIAAQDLVYQIQSGALSPEVPADRPSPRWPWAVGLAGVAVLALGLTAWRWRRRLPGPSVVASLEEPVVGRLRAEATGPMSNHQTGPVGYGPIGAAIRKAGDMIGPYRVERVVGSSLHSILYAAVDTRTGVPVALKQVGTGGEASEPVLARFQKEVQSLMAISSHLDGVVKVLDFLAPSMLVTEWVDGENLDEGAQLAIDEILKLGMALCEVLSFAHTQGIVHRDIKPSNVMRTRAGRVKLLDFGIAKNSALGTSNLTLDGNVPIGTFTYMSPEQFSAPNQARPAADLYSLGLTLYRLITNELPTEPWLGPRTFGLIPADQFRLIGRHSPALEAFEAAHPQRLSEEWIAELNTVIRRAFEENPSERPVSAVELRWQLEALIQGLALPPA